MITDATLTNILKTATDISVVAEIYNADAVPSASGFDPANAIGRFAAVAGISFTGQVYTRLVKSFGAINRTITNESNTATVTFSNLSRQISDFEFSYGFEGLILVIRLISRAQSVSLAASQILFTGRCEKPTAGSRDELTVTASWILGGVEVVIPRRKYTKEDQEGRDPSDPKFEGFLYIPQYGTASYSVRVSKGGILGLFGFKKTVQQTLSWSSFSDLDANKPVPEILGRTQILFTHIGYADVGTYLKVSSAICEGEVSNVINIRSLNSLMPISGGNHLSLGKTGTANDIDATWVAPGYYSRTAYFRYSVINSAVGTVDPAPEVAGVVLGRLMTVPDGSGNWVTANTWTDNPAAHTRFLLTSPDYFKLDANWIDDASFYTAWLYNDAQIIDRSISDFEFLVAG